MQKDEQAAMVINKRYIAVLNRLVLNYGGEILNDFGDGSLCSFTSATQAVKCAMEIQQEMQKDPVVPLRVGLHVGEMFFEDGKVFGDGVNIASRIQSLGMPNAVLFSSEINSKLINQAEFKTMSLGFFQFKNVDTPMEVFALANEGFLVPERNKMEGKLKKKNRKGRNWLIAASLILVVLVSYFLYHFYFHPASFSEGEKTIAVLPFDNAGVADKEEYISDGITQDIINNLAKIASLNKVIGWLSVKSFKKTTKSLKDVADELGVAAILSGSLQKHENKIHIIAELIEVNTNKRLWGDDFEYEGKDILSIQSKIAREIVAALRAKVTPEEKNNISKQYTENVEAYEYYLKGRNFWNARGPENFDSAESNYRKAIQLDPNYALAYAGIADCYTYNYKGMSQLQAIPIAREFALRSLALDSNLSEGLTSLGFIQYNFDYDWTGSKKSLERAIELEPSNPVAHYYYGNLLQFTGTSAEAGLKEAQKAVGLDPLAYGANWVLGRNYYFAGLYDKSVIQFKKTLELAPKQREVISWSLGLTYYQMKMYNESRKAFDDISACEHNNPIDEAFTMQALGYALLGDKPLAKKLLENALADKSKPWISPFRIAQVYLALGDKDKAISYLQKAYDIRDLHMFWIKVDPVLDPLKNDPRFIEILKKMNLA